MEKQDWHDQIQAEVKTITDFMRLSCHTEIREEGFADSTTVIVAVYTPESAQFLIGYDGQNLRAFEQLLRIICMKKFNLPYSVVLDVNDYRKSRAVQTIQAARLAMARVRLNQRAEALIPMSSYERRIVHMELAAYPDITTESIGEDPQRRVVIKLVTQ